MDLNLRGKIIYVTGATRGIGLAVTKLLLEQGCKVIANARSVASAEGKLNELVATYPDDLLLKYYDVGDEQAVKIAVREVQREYGGIDGLVNNAGVMHESAIAMTSMNALQNLLDINVKAAYGHLQLLSRLIMRNKGGSIVNISSVVARQTAPGQSAYSMSKASIEALTRSAAKELGVSNIRVNAVAPGFIETDMTAHYNDEQKQSLLKNMALNRLGKAEDVANAIGFLLSDHSNYITGQVIGIDGALTLA